MPKAAVCPKKFIRNDEGPNGRRFTDEYKQYFVDKTRGMLSKEIYLFAKEQNVSKSSAQAWWKQLDPINYPFRKLNPRKQKVAGTSADAKLIKEADDAIKHLMNELEAANATIEALNEEIASLRKADTLTDATTLSSYFWMGISAAGGTEDPVEAMKVLRSINEHVTN